MASSSTPAANDETQSIGILLAPSNDVTYCSDHKMEPLYYFCRYCEVLTCRVCILMDHPMHDCILLTGGSLELRELIIQSYRKRAADMEEMLKSIPNSFSLLEDNFHKSLKKINDTFDFYKFTIDERKKELHKELDSVSHSMNMSICTISQNASESISKINFANEAFEKNNTNKAEILMFKNLIDSNLQGLTSCNADTIIHAVNNLAFVSNHQAIHHSVKNTFGYIRPLSVVNLGPSKQLSITSPISETHRNGRISDICLSAYGICERPSGNGLSNPIPQFESSISYKQLSVGNSWEPNNTNGVNVFKGSDMLQNDTPLLDRPWESLLTSIFPSLPIKRQKISYDFRFGKSGLLEGQFMEPHGIAVNAQNYLLVADTNNHRVQILNKYGKFKFQFGGEHLRNPYRVAVSIFGDILVVERSPTKQLRIYNEYGQFVWKFSQNILHKPQGLAVDSHGRILVVECKNKKVIIFSPQGQILKKIDCTRYLRFPNGIAVNETEEMFISDNLDHCVKVFNYMGVLLREIGKGIVNFPIGVAINSVGEIIIADNHQNFNLNIFTQQGHLLSALESKRHAQCLGVAVMKDDTVVISAKAGTDYYIYIYHYLRYCI